jgi:hypothetical protein
VRAGADTLRLALVVLRPVALRANGRPAVAGNADDWVLHSRAALYSSNMAVEGRCEIALDDSVDSIVAVCLQRRRPVRIDRAVIAEAEHQEAAAVVAKRTHMTGKVRPVHIVAQIEPLLQLDIERLARIID